MFPRKLVNHSKFWKNPVSVPMSVSFSKHFQGSISGISKFCQGNISGISKRSQRNISGISKRSQGNISRISQLLFSSEFTKHLRPAILQNIERFSQYVPKKSSSRYFPEFTP